MLGAILVLLGLLALVAWVTNDRKENPEKWAAFDAEQAKKKAAKDKREYQAAMERLPKSKWMRMSREEKARVYERRENAARKRSEGNG